MSYGFEPPGDTRQALAAEEDPPCLDPEGSGLEGVAGPAGQLGGLRGAHSANSTRRRRAGQEMLETWTLAG